MTLRSLHLENYKQYGRLDLEFREGLVGIIGRNGAGKSTIFEAILYSLFGRDEANKSFIRSAFAEPKATVVLLLQFAVGPAEYAVKREFRGKAMAPNAEFYKNDQLIAKGVAAVNAEIGKVLNMEHEAFKRSVFSGQTELSDLSKVSGENRKKMVRKMLGLDTLDDIQKRMYADIRDLGNQITGQRQNLLDEELIARMQRELEEHLILLASNAESLKSEQAELRSVEAGYQQTRAQFEAEEQKQKHHHALQQECGRLQERIEGLTKQAETLNRKIVDLGAQQNQLAGQKAEFAAFESDRLRLRQLEAERQRFLNRRTNLNHLEELQAPTEASRRQLRQLETALAEKPKLELSVQQQQALINALEPQIEQKREAFNAVKSRIDTLAARVDERRQKLEQLQLIGREGTCPTCFQPVLDAYDDVVLHLSAEIEQMQQAELATLEAEKAALTRDGLQQREQLNQLRAGLTERQKELTALNELEKKKAHETATLKNYEAQATRLQVVLREIGDVQFDEKAFERLKADVAETEPRYQHYTNELAYVARELPAARTALGQAETALSETGALLQIRNAELAGAGYDADRYEQVKKALTQFGDAFAQQSGRVNALEKNGLELQNRIAQKREKLRADEHIRSQISTKADEVELLKKLSELLIQFKTEILEKVSPSISMQASELFSRITKGKYERIHVDENFDFAIADGGQLYPIERFSGGEIDLANFCLRIAITKAITELSGNGQGVEFLAFDEIFGSQDEERRQEMMLALHYLQEQFRQIYIVSHIESQKDYFPNLLEVTYRPEGSTAKWV